MNVMMYWIWLAVVFVHIVHAGSETIEVCTGEDFSISCGSQEVLLVNSAEYGRKEMGRCITKQENYMGCTSDVLNLLDRWCSGRPSCKFLVPNPDLESQNKDCLDYLKLYAKVAYSCTEVQTHCLGNQKTVLSDSTGSLSSYIASTNQCGTVRKPWEISVRPGQTVLLNILDFAGQSEGQGRSLVTCKHVYGYILERHLGINHTICGGSSRQMELYKSKTNTVEVHLATRGLTDNPQFIIEYSAVGCVDLDRPQNTWYKREGSEAVIGCETNDQEWRFTCIGNKWEGSMGNCSEKAPLVGNPQKTEEIGFNSLILVTGIACAVIVVVVITVMLGIIYLKKYRMKQETKQIQTTYATIGRYHQSTYKPISKDQSAINPLSHDQSSFRQSNIPDAWQTTKSTHPRDLLTSYPEPCNCGTLQPGNGLNTAVSRDSAGYEAPKLV